MGTVKEGHVQEGVGGVEGREEVEERGEVDGMGVAVVERLEGREVDEGKGVEKERKTGLP